MLIADLANSGSMPVLERALSFAAARQRSLVHNIANIDTPDFRMQDVSLKDFRASLREAVEARREGRVAGGGVEATTAKDSGNILYHDRNNRSVEGLMQDLAENALAYRLTTDLIRRETDILRTAISQRV